ncbi:hypothetical protein HMPREF1870_02782 [Bacteroidales bacterium KA00344]|nr:hypothetical protein HMPREF1870_02782 [Bacteroidales bacterium KA00344]
MKHIVCMAFIFGCLSLVSCSEKEDQDYSISFSRAVYILPAGESTKVEARLTQPADRDLEIPVVLSGKVEEGVDFTLSDHRIVINKGQQSGFITLNSTGGRVDDADIKIEMVAAPRNYIFGYYKSTIVHIQPRTIFAVSFEKDYYELQNELKIGMTVYVGSRKYSFPSQEVVVPFDILPSSTAIRGVHYEIIGAQDALVMGRKDAKAFTTIKVLKQENGKDIIVIKLRDTPYFLAGANNRIIVKIVRLPGQGL